MSADPQASDVLQYLPGGIFLLAVIIYLVFLVFLTVLWTFLPFAVFGVKKRLDKISGQLAALIDLEEGGQRRPSSPSFEESLKEMHEKSERWTGFTSASSNDPDREP